MKTLRVCHHCHNPYEARRPWQRFCSAACRMAAFLARKSKEKSE